MKLKKNSEIYENMGGGVTFSGGEPLMQDAFLLDTIRQLPRIHIAVETCAYAKKDVFVSVMNAVDLIMLDIKFIDHELHKRWCGEDNAPILENISILKSGDTPFIARVPLIPGVTDSEDNIAQIASHLKDTPALLYAELLPYNRLAGAKYSQLGARYEPGFDTEKPLKPVETIFEEYGINSRTL